MSSRTKRQKTDKTRFAALAKLKEARNSGKRKYEVEELENIYDEVDEKEYSNTVLKRQRDDWIVDDGIRIYVHTLLKIYILAVQLFEKFFKQRNFKRYTATQFCFLEFAL